MGGPKQMMEIAFIFVSTPVFIMIISSLDVNLDQDEDVCSKLQVVNLYRKTFIFVEKCLLFSPASHAVQNEERSPEISFNIIAFFFCVSIK